MLSPKEKAIIMKIQKTIRDKEILHNDKTINLPGRHRKP